MTGRFTSPELLRAELDRVAAAPALTVALDFDGTLAPLVDDPGDSRAEPGAVQAIDRLAGLGNVALALVSGRSLESLNLVAPLPSVPFRIGSHGAEWQGPGVQPEPAEVLREAAIPLRDALQRIRLEGARLEPKPFGTVLHTRGLDPVLAGELRERAREAAAGLAVPLFVREGKDVLDFSVADTGKDRAIRRLRAETGADAMLFVGDDVTDEDGFAALTDDDLGVKVGEGPTLAAVRIRGTREVAGLLELLADAREARVADGRA